MIENLDSSEIIDRTLVKWQNYAYENGNFLQTPEPIHQASLETVCLVNVPFADITDLNYLFLKCQLKRVLMSMKI